jgi:rhomboid protease GluP
VQAGLRARLLFLLLPYFVVSSFTIATYSLINFFLFQGFSRLLWHFTDVLLPIILCLVSFLFFFSPIWKTVVHRKGKGNSDFLLCLFMLPAMLLAQNMIANVGISVEKVSSERSIGDVNRRVFNFDTLTLDRSVTGVYGKIIRTSKKNSLAGDLYLEVYAVARFKRVAGGRDIWYGKKYVRKELNNYSTTKTQNEKLEIFKGSAMQKFDSLIANNFVNNYFYVDSKSEEYKYFEIAVLGSGYDAFKFIVLTDWSERRPNDSKFSFTIVSFFIGQFLMFIVCISVKMSNEFRISDLTRLVHYQKSWRNTFSYFIPRKNYFITPLIINANLLVFIIMCFGGVSVFDPTDIDLVNWGSNFTPAVRHGQLWRLFTSGFLHIGIGHMFMNMLALGYAGFLLEKVIGTKPLAVLYVISLFGCSVSCLIWNGNVNAAGASGAIFGIFGAMLVYSIFDITSPDNRILFMMVFVCFGFLTLLIDFTKTTNSDMAGHLGGLISRPLKTQF